MFIDIIFIASYMSNNFFAISSCFVNMKQMYVLLELQQNAVRISKTLNLLRIS